MIKIILCEDIKMQLTYYKEQLEKVIDHYDKGIFELILSTDKIEKILELINNKDNNDYYLFFLDINLNDEEIDGLELAKRIRKSKLHCEIVFLTSESGLAFKTYEYQLDALDYIVKNPLDMLGEFPNEELQCRIDSILTRVNNKVIEMEKDKRNSSYENKGILLDISGKMLRIYPKDIFYINAIKGKHQVEVGMKNRYFTINKTLTFFKDKLDQEFCYCNRSCLVNSQHIAAVDTKTRTVILKNGKKCDLSFRETKKIKDLFTEIRG